MSKPIITISYPIGDSMSRSSQREFLATQHEKLNNELNSNVKNYHILLFVNYLNAPIIEIHNAPDDSVDTIERFKERIQTIIDLMNPKVVFMDEETFKQSQQ